jgi:hypothetical protein
VLNAVAAILPNPDRQLSLDDRFFAIGGDSLNMVMVIEAVREQGNLYLPVTAFTPGDSVANWQKFKPQSTNVVAENFLRPEKSATEVLSDLAK